MLGIGKGPNYKKKKKKDCDTKLIALTLTNSCHLTDNCKRILKTHSNWLRFVVARQGRYH